MSLEPMTAFHRGSVANFLAYEAARQAMIDTPFELEAGSQLDIVRFSPLCWDA
jgi:hypothetical protein